METLKSPATIEDLERLGDTECRYDLIRGELIEMAPAGGAHGEIAAGIIGRLWNHVTANRLGRVYTSETGFILARRPDVVLAPDVAFIRSERVPERQRGFYEVAPDLTVEVISPDDSFRYLQDKVMEYLDAGVRLVWVVDPERQAITAYESDRPHPHDERHPRRWRRAARLQRDDNRHLRLVLCHRWEARRDMLGVPRWLD